MKSQSIKFLVVGIIVFLLGSYIHYNALAKGKAIVQAQFDEYKESRNKEILSQKEKYDAKEIVHRQTTEGLTNALAKANQDYAVSIGKLNYDYATRLRSSEDRAGIYKRQAESGPAECNRLASHAAKLDGSIEEGRSLVRELGITIRLRDEQIIVLGNQIKADRALLNESGQ